MKSDFPRTNKPCLISYWDILGTLCGPYRICFMLMHGGPTSPRVIWLMVILRSGKNTRGKVSKERAATYLTCTCKKRKNKSIQEILGLECNNLSLSEEFSECRFMANLTCHRAVAFFAAAKSLRPECFPRLLDPHKNPWQWSGYHFFPLPVKNFLDSTHYKENRVCSPDWRPKC